MTQVNPLVDSDASQRWRQLHIIADTPGLTYARAANLLEGDRCVWVGRHPPPWAEKSVSPEKIVCLLGREVLNLVFDAHEGFDADAFAIAAGLVIGGGRFLLLVPPLQQWLNTEQRFLQRLARLLEKIAPETPPSRLPASEDPVVATDEQVRVVEALRHVVHGHRKRPLVVVADRGRGKSAAFGMAAATSLAEGGRTVLVTAPRRSASLALFRHAALALPDVREHRGLLELGDSRLKFVAPDELLHTLPSCDLLLVDEAAGIPVPMLEKLLLHYKRIAFTTTVHGYEGSGKGFTLRFARVLDRHRSQWKKLFMHEPVRWAADDPLEKFTFRALLLDAEPAAVSRDALPDLQGLVIERLPRDDLLHNEALLRQLFGLLISAHYRTTPADLQHLMDAQNLHLWVAWLDECPVGTMLVADEGPLPQALHEPVMKGKRRPADHLLPLTLATRCGCPEALDLHCERVVRIAVHPALQQRGIGSRLLQVLRDSAPDRRVDLLGSSFGATPELVRFWRRNGFDPVRLGYRREASSGAHSVLVLQGLSPAAQSVQAASREGFEDRFPLQLAEVFSGLAPALVKVLMRGVDGRVPRLSQADRVALRAFSDGERQYLDCLGALYRLALYQLAHGADGTEILVFKLLQKRSWQDVAGAMGLPGKKAVVSRLRQHVALFLASCPENS